VLGFFFVDATAFVLAPFFVHLELLFRAGYRPALHRRIQNEVAKEIVKVKMEEKRGVRNKSTP
jgi:2-hydroxy fatty acid dioxygenase